MKRKRHSTQEIVRKLREADQLTAARQTARHTAGQTAAQVCQHLAIGEATLACWRAQFRGRNDDEIKRLRIHEVENRRLKKAVADLTLDKQILKELVEGKW